MKFLLAFVVVAGLFAAEPGAGRWRPQYHFTPPQNWTNDPNGLVFYKGEYHLFYQHNPFENKWGHMSWGHAVSPDLVHWQHLPVALAEEDGVMIFSGSVVVDANTSGLCKGGPDCLVAIYTGHTETRQSQHLAVSNDRGRTWSKYSGNPVLDLKLKDFRDPKVLRVGANWVMVVALPDQHKVRFYKSANLKAWELLSEFGPAGATGGNWECPDLFPLSGKWVLSVNLMPGGPQGGSGNQYFVGNFDGIRFTAEQAPVLWADHGADWYASTSFYGVPDGRSIWIGWLSNWLYANDEPTTTFRGVQSFPRVLSLRAGRLVQEPVAELKQLRGPALRLSKVTVEEANRALAEFHSQSYELEVEGAAAVHLLKGGGEETVITLGGTIQIDRRRSGQVAFSKDFPKLQTAAPATSSRARIFVDHSVIDLFASDGATVMTERVFPSEQADGLALSGTERVTLTVWKMK